MATKKEIIAQEVARAVGAGKAVALETVDFNDPASSWPASFFKIPRSTVCYSAAALKSRSLTSCGPKFGGKLDVGLSPRVSRAKRSSHCSPIVDGA